MPKIAQKRVKKTKNLHSSAKFSHAACALGASFSISASTNTATTSTTLYKKIDTKSYNLYYAIGFFIFHVDGYYFEQIIFEFKLVLKFSVVHFLCLDFFADIIGYICLILLKVSLNKVFI